METFKFYPVPEYRIALIVSEEGKPKALYETGFIGFEDDNFTNILKEVYGITPQDLKIKETDIISLEQQGKEFFSEPLYFRDIPKNFKTKIGLDEKLLDILDKKHDKPYVLVFVYLAQTYLKLPNMENGIEGYNG